MHRSRARAATGLLAAGLALALGVTGVAQAQPTTPAGGPARTLTLINGDQVRLTPNGGYQLPASSGPMLSYLAGGDRYLVPTDLLPDLGKQLDPSLFDATALARTPGRVPVRLTFTGTPTALPGVSIDSVRGNTATGHLDPGPAFTTALRRHPGLTKVALAGAAVVTPREPMHLLQLTVDDLAGAPADNAAVYLMQTDSPGGENALVPIAGGIGRVEVPAGHYAVVTVFYDEPSGGIKANSTPVDAVRAVSSYLTVNSTGDNTATITEQSATTQVTVHSPKPANQDYLGLNFAGQDQSGSVAGFAAVFGTAPTTPIYVNTLPALPVGKLRYIIQWGATATNPADDYRYDVAFASPNGVPADESYVVTPDQLATVRDRIYADPATTATAAQIASSAADPVLNEGDITFDTAPIAATETDYLGTGDGGIWYQAVEAPGLAYFGGYDHYAAGRTYTVDWGHGLLAPNFPHVIGPVPTCQGCVAGTNLQLEFNSAGNGEPDQVGALALDPTGADWTLYRNGSQLLSQTGGQALGGPGLEQIPAGAATYRLVYDADVTKNPGFSQSTVTHTDLTFRYDPNPGPGNELPADDGCIGRTATTPCELLPLLSLNYDLATDLHNTSHAPVQVLHLGVGHVSYDGNGSHASITSVTVKVSFDGGKTWQPVALTGCDGDYTAVWANSADAGTRPSLQVTATDADGGSISQTLYGAYTIATR